MILVLFFIIGSALVVAPWFVPQLDASARVASLSMGVILLALVAIAAVITRLYRKASANMAFVRTGMGGVKVIRDKGSVVVPVLHQVIPVSLETMRLNVERRGTHALITRDNLRVERRVGVERYLAGNGHGAVLVEADHRVFQWNRPGGTLLLGLVQERLKQRADFLTGGGNGDRLALVGILLADALDQTVCGLLRCGDRARDEGRSARQREVAREQREAESQH